MSENIYPTEIIELPSKGWFYPTDHPLASGKLEMRHMTAKHEDILTSRNLIQQGVVIDELMKALIVKETSDGKQIKYDDLLSGDRNGIMVAARIMGYGKNYDVTISCPSCNVESLQTVNLEDISDKPFLLDKSPKGKNEFQFTLPFSKQVVVFKFLTHKDEREIDAELESIRRVVKSNVLPEVTARMKKSIISINGETNPKLVREAVDMMPARDSKAFRDHVRKILPDIDLSFDFICPHCSHSSRVEVPIDVNFFWPDSTV